MVEKGANLFSFNFAFKQKKTKVLGTGFVPSAPIDDPHDDGFVIAERLSNNLQTFAKLLGNGRSDGAYWGMDWKSLSGYGNPNTSVMVFRGVLSQHISDLRLQTKRTKISSDVENILQKALAVANEMIAHMQQESSYGKSRTVELDRETVNSWQSTIRNCQVETAVLVDRKASARKEYKAGIESSKANSSVSSKSSKHLHKIPLAILHSYIGSRAVHATSGPRQL